MENQPKMFCYQCQETAKGKGCELMGVCGKHAETSARMDLLLYAVRGISAINRALREKGLASREASHEVIDALFTTITNANFDDASLDDFIRRAFDVKKRLMETAKDNGVALPDLPQIEFFATPEEADKYEAVTGVLSEPDADVRGLKQLAIYGCKGMAAYARHAANLGYEDDGVYAVIEDAMAETARTDIGVDELLPLVLKVGGGGVEVMA
ncbi:MAG: hydroxylamine reductase, partial [Duncaniella sp.]|nr:hydroxylamine reductase [Duncaniella sp.]